MKSLISLILVSVILVFSHTAFAKKKQTRKTQEVTFDGSDIDGQTRRPDGAYVNPKKGIKFLPLYKVNKKLDDSIKDSVEFVR